MNALLSTLGLTAEEWRPVPGYPEHEVSSLGRVRRIRPSSRNHPTGLLKFYTRTDGYVRVSMGDKGHYVHRIVLLAFVGPCPLGHEADHINSNRSDNRVENLRWLPKERNLGRRSMARGTATAHAKLTPEQVALARRLISEGRSRRSVAKELGVSSPAISRIANGTAWRHTL